MNTQRKVIIIVLPLLLISAYFVYERWTVQKTAVLQTNPEVTIEAQTADNTAKTSYTEFDVQKATIGMKVGNFTLAEIMGEGENKSYVFTGTSTVVGTYYLDGIDGPYFQTDKPIPAIYSNQTVTIPNYDFEFTNEDIPDSLLQDGEHVTIRITGYEYNGAIPASDGISDRTALISIIK